MPDNAPGDEALVAQLLRGSEAALGLLYDRHAPAVFRVAHRLLRDPGIAEEIVQETFLALWDRAEQFDPGRGALAAWLTVIARSRAIDRHRAIARRLHAEPFSTVVGDLPDPAATIDWLLASGTPVGLGSAGPSPEAFVASTEARAAIARAVGALAADERLAIVLAYRDGLSQSEIAERLGWPLGTVKTRSRRALRRLREALEDAGASPVATGSRTGGHQDPRPREPFHRTRTAAALKAAG